MKKVYTIVITFLILIVHTMTALGATVKDLENSKANVDNRIQTIRQQKAQQQQKAQELLGEAEELKGNVDEKEKQLDELTQDLQNIIAYLNEVQASIAEAEENLKQREEEAVERLRVMYENSNKTIFDLLAESGNLSEFFEKLELYKWIAQKDNEVIMELDVARKELEIKRAMLDGDYTQLVADINKTKEDLDNLRLTRADLLENISKSQEQIRSLSSQEDQLEQESRNLAAQIKNMQTSGKYVGGTFTWPLPSDYTVHSKFGWRRHPVYGDYRMHTGVDIGGPYGAAIVAANSGTVIFSGYGSGYGYYIIIDHGGGYSTLYGHSSKLLVSKGTYVQKGQTIALVGSTGVATGPHLHFEVRINGDPVDPMNYFKKQ
jgi:murein DD-endopeptidase MepM/ murein hydrolase activator NlpD